MVSILLPTFDTSFSSPLEEKLTSDGKSATGKITILPGVKVDGVAGGTTTIGGISSTVKVNKLEDGCIICFSERFVYTQTVVQSLEKFSFVCTVLEK